MDPIIASTASNTLNCRGPQYSYVGLRSGNDVRNTHHIDFKVICELNDTAYYIYPSLTCINIYIYKLKINKIKKYGIFSV